MLQSDAKNLSTNLATVFANLPSGTSTNVAIGENSNPGATLSGSGQISVGGEVIEANLSPQVTLTKTGNADPTDGAGLKLTYAGLDNYVCVIPLPFSVAYSWGLVIGPTCGEVISEAGNLMPESRWRLQRSSLEPSEEGSIKISSLYGGYCSPYLTYSAAIPVTEGEVITGTAELVNKESANSTTRVLLVWVNSDGVAMGGTAESEPLSAASGTMSVTGTAPAGAVKVSLFMRAYGTDVGDSFTWKKYGVWKGSGGSWQPPGVPIVN